jgi:hypothetical protein
MESSAHTAPDAIQPSKDLLEVPVGPFTRLRAKKFKEAFNGLLQDTWAKVDFKRICNNKEQAFINLIHVQEGLVGGTDCASKVSLSLLFYICIYCFYLGFL